ncbi:LysM peptidoglycan-binding domain-containing protein [Kurthia gibsonii]|uniref:LysM peptidoglycan-binding domain-containing protein n=1 Tax=Kurthia gibsonii TaxID=33946 RepID=UPI0031B72590
MSQNDYKERVEAHRQSIQVEDNGTSEKPTRMSRKQQREAKAGGKPPKKNKNNSLLTVLAVVFVMIPAAILIYTFVIKSDTPTKEAPKAAGTEHVEIETNQNDEKDTKETQTKDSTAKADDVTKEEKQAAKEKEAKQKAEQEKAEQEKAEQEKAEQEKRAAEKKKEEEKKKQPVETVKPSSAYTAAIQGGYLHNAVEGDTIQSISIKYYGSEAYVNQIKQLNGITADRVPAGTKVALIKTQ